MFKKGVFPIVIIVLATVLFFVSQPSPPVGSIVQDDILEEKESKDTESKENLISLTEQNSEEANIAMLNSILESANGGGIQEAIKLAKAGGDTSAARKIIEDYVKEIETMDKEDAYATVEEMYRTRELFQAGLWELFPQQITLDKYIVQLRHGDELMNGDMVSTYEIKLLRKDNLKEALDVALLTPDIGRILSAIWTREYAYVLNNRVYVKLDTPRMQQSPQPPQMPSSNAITGYQVYQPPTPNFNQRPRNVAVLLPYTTTSPLPQNYQQILTPKLADVRDYFLAASESTARFSFTLYPVQVSDEIFNDVNIVEIIRLADPTVNYANYDFVSIIEARNYFGGYAHMWVDNGMPYYFQTKDGPLAAAFPVIIADYRNTDPDTITEYSVEHEIGHILNFWNPQFNARYFWGYVPHAAGFAGICRSNINQVICSGDEYDDRIDVMGRGRGLFAQHSAVYRMGLRSVSTVQTVQASGTYALCDINHNPPSNCPQELLIANPNGVNLALELRTPTGPDSFYIRYGCSQQLFEGVFARAVDREEGGSLNGLVFNIFGWFAGDVLLPYAYSTALCPSSFPYPMYFMRDYPIPIGQSMQTTLGSISVLSLNIIPNGGKQATVQIDYSPAPCVSNPSTVTSYPPHQPILYTDNLWPVHQERYQLGIANGDHCRISSIYTLNTDVTVGSNTHSAATTVSVPFSVSREDVDVPFPSSLLGIIGSYPYRTTVTEQSTQQITTFSGMMELVRYAPQIVGPFGVSTCYDEDPVLFTPQNLGANFDLYHQYAAVTFNPRLPGIPYYLAIAEGCIDSPRNIDPLKAFDVVCGSNTPFPELVNLAYMVVEDCRFIRVMPRGSCYAGYCTYRP